MARKRMFDIEVVDTDLFLDMPQTTQNLYFHFGMRADDDGFVSKPKKIIRLIGANEDDLKILITKQFVIPFKSGIIVIRHWKLNNYLRKDRYIETIYKEEKDMLIEDENGVYNLGIPNVNQMSTNGVPSIEKNSIDKKNNICPSNEGQPSKEDKLLSDFEQIWNIYPRKEGKNSAFSHYKSWIKGKKYAGKTIKLNNKQMWYAVKKYADEVKNIEKKYIKMGSSFFNEKIMDYVEVENE